MQVPNGCYGHFLLGQICKMSNRPQHAIKHYETALTMNPMLWSAYEELCSLGALAAYWSICTCSLQVGAPLPVYLGAHHESYALERLRGALQPCCELARHCQCTSLKNECWGMFAEELNLAEERRGMCAEE